MVDLTFSMWATLNNTRQRRESMEMAVGSVKFGALLTTCNRIHCRMLGEIRDGIHSAGGETKCLGGCE
jgi:hypothetical protein